MHLLATLNRRGQVIRLANITSRNFCLQGVRNNDCGVVSRGNRYYSVDPRTGGGKTVEPNNTNRASILLWLCLCTVVGASCFFALNAFVWVQYGMAGLRKRAAALSKPVSLPAKSTKLD